MSDSDSLDGLIDDIDMDALLNPTEDCKSAAAVYGNDSSNNSNNNIKIENEQDLDDFVDGFFAADEESSSNEKAVKPGPGDKNTKSNDSIDDDDDGGLASHLQIQKIHNIEKALHTLPSVEMKKKWIDILSEDVRMGGDDAANNSTAFKRSYAYLEWQDPVEHFVVDKAMRNMILRACSKSNMSDAQAKKLQDRLFHDPELLKKYVRHIIKEKSADIKKDPDLSDDRYPALSRAINNI